MHTTGSADEQRSVASGAPQPILETIRAVLRLWPVVLGVTALAVAGAFWFTRSDTSGTSEATARVGLTYEVVWPYYDAVRERSVGIATEPALLDQVRAELDGVDGSVLEITTEMPVNQAFLDVTSRATTDAVAIAAAARVADEIIASSLERQSADRSAAVESQRSTLDSLNRTVAEIEAQVDELTPLTASEVPEIAEPARVDRDGLNQERNELLRRRATIEIDLAVAESDLSVVAPEVEILTPSRLADADDEQNIVALVAAALGAFVVGSAIAIGWDRSRGVLTSRWQVEELAGLPVLGDDTKARNPDRSMSSILARVGSHGGQSNIVAAVGLNGSGADGFAASMADYAERAGLKAAFVGPRTAEFLTANSDLGLVTEITDRPPPMSGSAAWFTLPVDPDFASLPHARERLHEYSRGADIVMIEVSAENSDSADYAISLADSAVIVGRARHDRVDQLVGTSERLRSKGLDVLGMVFSERKPRRR